MKKQIRYATLLLLVILASCVSVEGLETDSSFTFAALSQGGLAMGGIVVTENGDSIPKLPDATLRSRSLQLARIMENAFVDERKEIPVVTPAVFSEKLGDQKYQALLLKYRESGEVSPSMISAAGREVQGAHYVAFALVEQDRIDRRREEIEEQQSFRIVMSTIRTESIKFDVMDLATAKRVWKGTISRSATRAETYFRSKGIIINLLNFTMETGADYKYPDAPPVEKTIAFACDSFADKLPKK